MLIGTQAAANTATGFVPRPDPVNPDRNALFFSSANSTNNNLVGAALRKVLPVVNEVLVGGFSLYIPPEYVKSPVTSANIVFRMVACASSDANWSAAAANDKEVFRITGDLLVKWFTDAAQSSKALVPGRLNYIEYRISEGEIRIWIDDVLVMQKSKALNVESVGLIFEQNSVVAPNTYLTGAAGRWSIGNWYNLVEDIYAPNVRLGPTTRVIGIRPSGDVAAQFLRPTGAASNASVVAQDLVDQPPSSLQSSNVGDQDIYSVVSDNGTSNGKLIHAVATKVLAANLESNPHAIRPTLFNSAGGEAAPVRSREFRAASTAITARNLWGIARRPTDGKLFAVGSGFSVFTNTSNGSPGSAWATVFDDGSAGINTGIAFRADGTGVISRNDGKIGVIPIGSDVPTILNPSGNSAALNCVIALPSGRFFLVGALGTSFRSDDPVTLASWTRTILQSLTYLAVAFAPSIGAQGRLVTVSNDNASNTNYATSDDAGVTFTTRKLPGITAAVGAMSWDGTAFMATTATMPPIWRSTDGINWVAPANTSANGIGGSSVFGAWEYGDTQTFVGGTNGAMCMSHDTNSYRPISRVVTTTLRGGCKAANGDWVFVGDAGTLVSYTASLPDAALPALGGYVPAFNAHNVNPATGQAWTPAEAAASQFGMRLVS